MVSDKLPYVHGAGSLPTVEMRVHWLVSGQPALPVGKNAILNDWPIVRHRRCPLRKGWDWMIKAIAVEKHRDRRVVVGYVYQVRQAKSDIIPDICRIVTAGRVQFVVRYLETESHLIHDVAESHECILVRLKRAGKKDVAARRQELDVPAKGAHRRRHGCAGHTGWLEQSKGAMAEFEGSERHCDVATSR